MQRRRATATLCEERNNTVSVRIGPEVQGVPFWPRGATAPPGVDLAEPDASVAAGLEHLTARQIEVLRLVARGMTNNEIAETLFLSRRTVHAHLRSIFHKLGVGHRSAATRYAVQHGLL